MSQERKYDIGHGVLITATKYSLKADWKSGEYSSQCIGIHRPLPKPVGTVSVRFSLKGDSYYLPDYCHGFMAWLGATELQEGDERSHSNKSNVFGPGVVRFTSKSGPETYYYRQYWPFNSWKIKEGIFEDVVIADPLVQDYLLCEQERSQEDERRFNEAISFTGRDLKWILNKIGPWVDVPEEPVVVLTD